MALSPQFQQLLLSYLAFQICKCFIPAKASPVVLSVQKFHHNRLPPLARLWKSMGREVNKKRWIIWIACRRVEFWHGQPGTKKAVSKHACGNSSQHTTKGQQATLRGSKREGSMAEPGVWRGHLRKTRAIRSVEDDLPKDGNMYSTHYTHFLVQSVILEHSLI